MSCCKGYKVTELGTPLLSFREWFPHSQDILVNLVLSYLSTYVWDRGASTTTIIPQLCPNPQPRLQKHYPMHWHLQCILGRHIRYAE